MLILPELAWDNISLIKILLSVQYQHLLPGSYYELLSGCFINKYPIVKAIFRIHAGIQNTDSGMILTQFYTTIVLLDQVFHESLFLCC